jgi:hypothetical protein
MDEIDFIGIWNTQRVFRSAWRHFKGPEQLLQTAAASQTLSDSYETMHGEELCICCEEVAAPN